MGEEQSWLVQHRPRRPAQGPRPSGSWSWQSSDPGPKGHAERCDWLWSDPFKLLGWRSDFWDRTHCGLRILGQQAIVSLCVFKFMIGIPSVLLHFDVQGLFFCKLVMLVTLRAYFPRRSRMDRSVNKLSATSYTPEGTGLPCGVRAAGQTISWPEDWCMAMQLQVFSRGWQRFLCLDWHCAGGASRLEFGEPCCAGPPPIPCFSALLVCWWGTLGGLDIVLCYSLHWQYAGDWTQQPLRYLYCGAWHCTCDAHSTYGWSALPCRASGARGSLHFTLQTENTCLCRPCHLLLPGSGYWMWSVPCWSELNELGAYTLILVPFIDSVYWRCTYVDGLWLMQGGSAYAWKLAMVDWRRGRYRNGLSIWIYMVDAFALAIGATIFWTRPYESESELAHPFTVSLTSRLPSDKGPLFACCVVCMGFGFGLGVGCFCFAKGGCMVDVFFETRLLGYDRDCLEQCGINEKNYLKCSDR